MEKPLPDNSRRNFLGNLGAAIAALSIPAALSAADAAKAETKALPRKKITDPYIYKFAIAVLLTPLLYGVRALVVSWIGSAEAERLAHSAHPADPD